VDHVDVAAVHDAHALQVHLVELGVVVAERPQPVDRRGVADAARPEAGARTHLGALVVRGPDDRDVGVERRQVLVHRRLREACDTGEGKVEPTVVHAHRTFEFR
jgi:hypothetical protein